MVPGHKSDWMHKAAACHPDALLFDLEDAVPVSAKHDARRATSEAVRAADPDGPTVFVRVNGWGSGHALHDLGEVVGPGLFGIALAKTDSADDIVALDRVISELERDAGLEVGGIEILPIMETARAMWDVGSIFAAPRVRRGTGVIGVMPGGDYHRALGNQWTEDGLESLYVSSRTVLAARANGFRNVIAGVCAEVRDTSVLATMLRWVRQLGANGAFAIHPLQVPLMNDAFSPSADEIERARSLLDAMAAALARGDAATMHDGQMVDYANVRSAVELLDLATSFGMAVGHYERIAVPDLD
jgi:citrate lyase subunit beta/citryl-CoA lyase